MVVMMSKNKKQVKREEKKEKPRLKKDLKLEKVKKNKEGMTDDELINQMLEEQKTCYINVFGITCVKSIKSIGLDCKFCG